VARTLTRDIGASGFYHQLPFAADDVIGVSRSLSENGVSRTKEEICRITFDQQTKEQA